MQALPHHHAVTAAAYLESAVTLESTGLPPLQSAHEKGVPGKVVAQIRPDRVFADHTYNQQSNLTLGACSSNRQAQARSRKSLNMRSSCFSWMAPTAFTECACSAPSWREARPSLFSSS
jgi:hypothetical protein